MKFIWNICELQGNMVHWWNIFNFLEKNRTGKIYSSLWENEKNWYNEIKDILNFFSTLWKWMVSMKCFSTLWKWSQIGGKMKNITPFFSLCRDNVFSRFSIWYFSIWKRCKPFKFFPFHRNKMDLLTIFQFLEIETEMWRHKENKFTFFPLWNQKALLN